jgi:MFS family permease
VASQTFRSLRERNARIFFLGLLVSNVGTWLQLTATSVLVYHLTHQATDVGLTIASQFLPMLLLGAWAGALADRVNRRKMTLITQSLLALQAAILAVLDLTGVINLPLVYALSLAVGVVNAFDNPARRGFVTELVDPEDIPNAMALNTAVMTGSRIFGPALAAVLISSIGTGWCFAINSVSFLAILFALLTIDVSQLRPVVMAPPGGTPVRDALRVVWHNKRLLLVFVLLAVVSTFAFNYNVSLVRLADKRFGNEDLFGLLLAAVSVGSLLGALFTAGRQVVSLRFFIANTMVLGASGIALAWAPSFTAALVVAVPLGFGGAAFISASNSISQQECPPEMRSRLLALIAVAFLGSTPIGAPITGWIGDNVSAEWSLAYGSVITLVSAGVAATLLLRSRSAQPRPRARLPEPAAIPAVNDPL